MNRSIAAALGLAIAFACGAASAAQNTPAKKPAAKPAAKAPAEAPLPEATGEQTAAAAMTHFGDYACEFNQSVKVSMTLRGGITSLLDPEPEEVGRTQPGALPHTPPRFVPIG